MTTKLIELSGGRWLCPETELVVVATPRSSLWRVYNTAYRSPLNPPARSGEPGKSWSRFDVSRHATLYAAGAPRCAYAESLAYAGLQPDKLPLHTIFDDVSESDDPVAVEWAEASHLPQGQVAADWRLDRRLAEIVFEGDGWFVDLSAAETVGALRREAAASRVYWSGRVDLADLLGGDRQLTCAVAAWLSSCKLADKSVPRGLRYVSKHGGAVWCWAMWVPVTPGEDAEAAVAQQAWCAQKRLIRADDQELRWAARQLGLTPW